MTQRSNFIHEFRDAVLSKHGPPTALARLVALAVAKTMNRETLESFAGAEHLAMLSGLSERAVRSILAQLVRDGWLQERTKASGRNYWLKVRRAVIPASRVPAPTAGTQPGDSLHGVQALNGRESLHGVPQVPAARAAESLHGVPGNSSLRTLVPNPEDPHPQPPLPQNGRGGGSRAIGGRSPRPERTERDRSLTAWREATTLIAQVAGTNRTWAFVREHCADKLAFAAAEAVGCKAIAERDKFNTKELQARFREAYERLLRQQAESDGASAP